MDSFRVRGSVWRRGVAALAFVASNAVATEAYAAMHLIVFRDVSIDPSLGIGYAGDDLSPSLAGTRTDGVWLAWYRLPGDGSVVAPISAAHATDVTGNLAITQQPAGVHVTALGISHDGSEPVVFVASVMPSGGSSPDLYAWRPRETSPVVQPLMYGLSALVRQMEAAQYASLSAFDIGIATGAPRVETIVASTTAAFTAWSAPAHSYSNATRVAAARLTTTDVGLFAIGEPAAPGSTLLLADRSGAHVDFSYPSPLLDLAIAPTPSGSFRVAVLDSPDTVTSLTISPPGITLSAHESDHFPTSTLVETALAPDDRTGGAWSVSLGSSPDTLWVHDDTTTTPANFHIDSNYAGCLHLEAATTPAFPDDLFVTMTCSYHSGLRHVVYVILSRDPPSANDAGADASSDAVVDVVPSDVPVPTDDGVPGDATMTDTPSNPVDSGPPLGTGPGFRGGACSCSAAGAAPRGRFALAILAVALAVRRRGRRQGWAGR